MAEKYTKNTVVTNQAAIRQCLQQACTDARSVHVFLTEPLPGAAQSGETVSMQQFCIDILYRATAAKRQANESEEEEAAAAAAADSGEAAAADSGEAVAADSGEAVAADSGEAVAADSGEAGPAPS
jgi:hypothetical protein